MLEPNHLRVYKKSRTGVEGLVEYGAGKGSLEQPFEDEIMANIGEYASSYASFEWGPPERFNFGWDVIDGWEEDRPAMTWLGTSGEERRLTFGDFSRLCSKFANVAREMGVGRGDRVMVLLGMVPERHVTLTGLLKLGES